MYEAEIQSVLRCGQCNKPFDKESTLKRHGYYCRSRRAGSTIRSRSCISCAKSKARCDNRRPECSRCIVKAITCHYPVKPVKDAGPGIQQSSNAPTEQGGVSPLLGVDSLGVETRQESSLDDGIILDRALALSDPDFATLGEEYLDWDDRDIDFADFLNPQMSDKSVDYPSSGSSALVRHSTPSPNQRIQTQQAISYLNTFIPTSPSYNVRSLIPRSNVKTEVQRIANLTLHTLKSYPLMMLRQNTLPPFIHPRFKSFSGENDDMEPLNNCISLVHMISHKVQGSRKLFWKNVRMECERLHEDHLKLNKWELLAGLQALSIYILLRLDEGETDHNNFDFLLITTVTAISKRLTYSDIIDNYGPESGWKDWIFEESRRRLCVVYQVVNLLVYFEPAAMCDLHTDLVLAPLPAKKQLWEASDEFMWRAENEREPGPQSDFGLAANGELVRLDDDKLCCTNAVTLHKSLDTVAPSASTANWEEWCSGMDGLGGLVMLAASLVG